MLAGPAGGADDGAMLGDDAARPPTPTRPDGRRSRARLPEPAVLRNEVWLVLGLSLLASAAYAVLSLLEAPLRGRTVVLFADVNFVRQLLGIAVDLVPVALVLHLLQRSGESAADIGLDTGRVRADVIHGTVLAAIVGSVGLALYFGAVGLGVNRGVVPAPPAGHWWTVPILLLGAARSGLLEEIIVCGYLLHRLDQLGWSKPRALGASALLRASYHLYQGWGGFVSNLALGLLFGRIYQTRGRTAPLVVAHFLIDAVAGIGWLALHGRVSWLPG
jgi:membrane protease YdiL (CAAX protease family)